MHKKEQIQSDRNFSSELQELAEAPKEMTLPEHIKETIFYMLATFCIYQSLKYIIFFFLELSDTLAPLINKYL
jgi:hypothetical protein